MNKCYIEPIECEYAEVDEKGNFVECSAVFREQCPLKKYQPCPMHFYCQERP